MEMRKGKARQGKSKTTAVLLAVFLSQWSWVYTYRDNAWKFWTALAINMLFFWMWFIPPILTNLWAIIDNATADPEYFEKYWK